MKTIITNVLSHIYYSDISELTDLKDSKNIKYNFFYNLCSDNVAISGLKDFIIKNHPNATFTISPNIGKDIGGKLVLIDLALHLSPSADFYIFIHDKRSPHTTMGDIWKKKLFRVIDPEKEAEILNLFDKDKKIGIVASSEFIMNEYDKKNDIFYSNNSKILKKLISKYGLHLKNHDFVGGTMFWIRAEIVNSFFCKYDPMYIRSTLEYGNVLDHEKGSCAHSWERMLSWIAIDQGYYIKGI